ncbi:helix-turn-helix transcriptional regulator [Nocardiopsis sp. N85]|uniref:helix-turn-helix domain-containing protein n=1 Tax=Nocardiopsis sp. N85 TaxID=3029400 RepID=UPI00237F6154|nr:helix-turn-helix transcriptional regulator [Nocardiopsis sp. N85]MDE3725342.1 helix-turn-helix transcriptional regulator [Nocardiopsis sp. N85]
MSTQKNPLGPIGDTVRHNVKRIREARSLTYAELSRRLTAVGREIPTLGLSRIEEGKRRVDTDDLVALAMVFDVSPVTLLLPPAPPQSTGGRVTVLPERSTPWRTAWRWAHGEHPYWEPGSDNELRGDDDRLWLERLRRFISENRPYEQRPVEEIDRFLSNRIDGPWHLEMDHGSDGTTTSSLSQNSVMDARRRAEENGET